jgi:hypothetical protein
VICSPTRCAFDSVACAQKEAAVTLLHCAHTGKLPHGPFVLPRPRLPSHTQPLQHFVPRKLLTYVDIYMDDFLGLAQGHPKLRHHLRDTIFHAIDAVFRPNDSLDDGTPQKEPISLSKLQKGDALWATRKVMLSWIIDTVAETIELPDHQTERLSSLLNELLALRRISIKRWKKVLGELRSMVLAIPGGCCLFSTFYVALGDPSSDSRIKINRPIRDALLDLQSQAQDLGGHPTRIGELVDTLPVAYGTADSLRCCGELLSLQRSGTF